MASPSGPDYRNHRWAIAMLDNPALSHKAKMVGVAIALKWAGRRTLADIRPGTERLQRATGLARSSVSRGLAELIEAGYLKRVTKGHYGRASLYVGTFPRQAKRSHVSPDEVPTWTCPGCSREYPEPVAKVRRGEVDVCRTCGSDVE